MVFLFGLKEYISVGLKEYVSIGLKDCFFLFRLKEYVSTGLKNHVFLFGLNVYEFMHFQQDERWWSWISILCTHKCGNEDKAWNGGRR